MINNYYNNLNRYLARPYKKEINWFDLPETMYLLVKDKIISIKKLILLEGRNVAINKQILGVLVSSKKGILKMKFPINLDQASYFKIYALMISEGSIRTEFSLNVPEAIFHKLFYRNLKELISKNIKISKDFNHGFERSRAPAIIRNLIPLEEYLPKSIFFNKKYAKEYLKIAFEAEGCPIYNLRRSKKYIKVSRNSDITSLFKKKLLPPEKRIFIKEIKQNFPREYQHIILSPPPLILGEHLLLKHCFNIDSTLKVECIRANKVGNRKGGISSKWVLYIYGGEDLRKFCKEVSFISKRKKDICREMLKNIPSRKKQYFALEIMGMVAKNKVFSAKIFNKEMKKRGYTSPAKFIWDYNKNKKIIKRLSRGKYQIIN